MNIVAILQARMGSTRLPNKVLLPLAGKPMLKNIVERISRATMVKDVVLAVPAKDTGHFLGMAGQLAGIGGDESDLIMRYLDVAITHRADIIVRVPCDNPCVDPGYIDRAIEAYLTGRHIFYANTVVDVGGVMVDGLGCEVFSVSRLKLLDTLTRNRPDYREHPHKWFYDHLPIRDPDAHLRLDVNTLDDYHFIEKIYNHFGHNRFTAAEILACPPVQERVHGRG